MRDAAEDARTAQRGVSSGTIAAIRAPVRAITPQLECDDAMFTRQLMSCDATVGEFEACIDSMYAVASDRLRSFRCSAWSDLGNAATTFQEPPNLIGGEACQSLAAKCDGLFEDVDTDHGQDVAAVGASCGKVCSNAERLSCPEDTGDCMQECMSLYDGNVCRNEVRAFIDCSANVPSGGWTCREGEAQMGSGFCQAERNAVTNCAVSGK
jgi:hypothetical protein